MVLCQLVQACDGSTSQLPLTSEEHAVTNFDILRVLAQHFVEDILVSFLCFPDSFLCHWDHLGEPFSLMFEVEWSFIFLGRK